MLATALLNRSSSNDDDDDELHLNECSQTNRTQNSSERHRTLSVLDDIMRVHFLLSWFLRKEKAWSDSIRKVKKCS